MKLFLGGILMIAACGSVSDNTPPDAPVVDTLPHDTAPDVDAPPPRCDPSKSFGTPVKIDALTSNMDDITPFVSTDELTLIFASSRAGVGSLDLYISTRATTSATWGTPVLLNGVNTTGAEYRPSFSADQLTLYATYQANPNAGYQLTRATRSSTSLSFGALSPVTVLNGAQNNYDPYVLPDDGTIYFTTERNGTPDLYIAQGAGGNFGAPTAVVGTTLNTTGFESSPTVTPDQLNLYFRSDRGGTSYDIWYASRTSIANGFGAPVSVTAVNGGTTDVPSWISPDNCVLYFHRDIGAGAPSYDIFMAQKPL